MVPKAICPNHRRHPSQLQLPLATFEHAEDTEGPGCFVLRGTFRKAGMNVQASLTLNFRPALLSLRLIDKHCTRYRRLGCAGYATTSALRSLAPDGEASVPKKVCVAELLHFL